MMNLLKFRYTQVVGKISLVLTLLVLISMLGFTCNAVSYEDYAPIFYFEKDECCYPVDVSYLFDNVGGIDKVSSLDVEGNTLYYYDNPKGTSLDNGVVNDYQSKISQYGYTVYYRVNTSVPGYTFIQYWMFYAFNKGEQNHHEGDWEMVEVVIPDSGEKWVAYSQHYSGQKAMWSQVEREEDHIKVYVARGSHANYLRCYSGKLGIASDVVGCNGQILRPGDYDLVELGSQSWLVYNVLWGEVNSVEDFVLGRAGPQGPMFRQDMNGNYMWNGITWGEGLLPASDLLFMLEWFLYHFVTIFIIITLVSLLIMFIRIYRRHKKYGPGPRIVSMLYIDGFNLKSIGNILCFAGIIIAVFGLINEWYVVSADINVEGYQTSGMIDVISINGLNGVQVTLPGLNGPVPMGSVLFPFSLVILVGFVFMTLSTIGIYRSRKLGVKYLSRGIKLIVLIVLLLVSIMALGMIANPNGSSGFEGGDYVARLIGSISSKPFGGEYVFSIGEENVNGLVSVKWGMGIGAVLLFVSGVIFLIAGVLEITANKVFFKPKTPVGKTEDEN